MHVEFDELREAINLLKGHEWEPVFYHPMGEGLFPYEMSQEQIKELLTVLSEQLDKQTRR